MQSSTTSWISSPPPVADPMRDILFRLILTIAPFALIALFYFLIVR